MCWGLMFRGDIRYVVFLFLIERWRKGGGSGVAAVIPDFTQRRE